MMTDRRGPLPVRQGQSAGGVPTVQQKESRAGNAAPAPVSPVSPAIGVVRSRSRGRLPVASKRCQLLPHGQRPGGSARATATAAKSSKLFLPSNVLSPSRSFGRSQSCR